jgi:hypothetical protein
MPAKTAHRLRIAFFVLASLLAPAWSAEPAHPLLGASRDQVLRKLGGPKSQLEAGSRTVLLYQNERIILRDNVVVEVEPMSSLPVRPVPVPASEASASVGAVSAPKPSEFPASSIGSGSITPASAAPGEPMPGGGNEPKVEIKLVRPPSANYARQPVPPPEPVPAAVAVVAPVVSSPAAQPVVPVAQPTPNPPVPAVEPVNAPKVEAPKPPPLESGSEPSKAEKLAAEQARAEKLAAEAAAKEMKAKAVSSQNEILELQQRCIEWWLNFKIGMQKKIADRIDAL